MGTEQNQPKTTAILPELLSCFFVLNRLADIGFAKNLSQCSLRGRNSCCLVLAELTSVVVESRELGKEGGELDLPQLLGSLICGASVLSFYLSQ